MLLHMFRHIVRVPAKTLLSIGVALLFALALGVLQLTIVSIRQDIERLYNETIVTGEVGRYQYFGRSVRPAGDTISIMHLWGISELGTVGEVYVEASYPVFIAPVLPYRLAPLLTGLYSAGAGSSRSDSSASGISTSGVAGSGLAAFNALDYEELISEIPTAVDILVAVCELRHLTEDSPGFIGRSDPFRMHVSFAAGHDEGSFVYAGGYPIPIIISYELGVMHGLSYGDGAYIVYYRPGLFRPGVWYYAIAVVIGIHDGGGLAANVRDGAVLPLGAMEAMLGEFTGFYTLRFAIDPVHNRQLSYVREEIESVFVTLRYPRLERLRVTVWDQELRFGTAPLARQAELMGLLRFLMVGVSAVIGGGFTLLLTLQMAKNAAIMRVTGTSKLRVQVVLWFGQMLVCVVGSGVGLVLVVAFGLRADIVIVAVPYVLGAAAGAVIGAGLVTRRSPLELLQVKE